MTELEYRKELLKTKIEAHRTILGLELRATRAAFDPLGAALSLLGADRHLAELLVPILRAATAGLGPHDEAEPGPETEDA